MLPKKNRVGKKEVERIFELCPPRGSMGKAISSPAINFKFFKNIGQKSTKVSFIVPKNVSRLAVGRNLLRRRGYAALNPLFSKIPDDILGVFIFKKFEDNVSVLGKEIETILDRVH